MGQSKLLSFLVVYIGEEVISTTLLLFLVTSGMGRITVVDHDNLEVSNLYWQVIYTKGRRGTVKDTSIRNAMRFLNPTVLVTAVTEPLTWENAMYIGRGNYCAVDIRDNPPKHYLVNCA